MTPTFPLSPSVGQAASDASRGWRALVVDDSELALQFLERALGAMGVQTERATRSQDALACVAREAFDFVLVDIDLGERSETDGLTLCRRIKRDMPRRPGQPAPVVIVVSVHAGEMDRVRGMLAGCDAFFGKPPDLGALRRTLASHGVGGAAELDLRRRA